MGRVALVGDRNWSRCFESRPSSQEGAPTNATLMTCVSSAPINAIGPALHRDQTSKKEASWSRSNRCLTSVSFPEQRLLLARLYLRFDTRRTPRNLISA